jgi:hypothetical protein
VDCFRHGGGVPYSAFPRFTAIMAEDSGAVHDATLIDVTLPLVPGLIDRLRQATRLDGDIVNTYIIASKG